MQKRAVPSSLQILGFAAQTQSPSWLCTGKADMVRFCISKEHMFGINQTTFALAEAGVQKRDNPGEIWIQEERSVGPVLKPTPEKAHPATRALWSPRADVNPKLPQMANPRPKEATFFS